MRVVKQEPQQAAIQSIKTFGYAVKIDMREKKSMGFK